MLELCLTGIGQTSDACDQCFMFLPLITSQFLCLSKTLRYKRGVYLAMTFLGIL